MFVLVASLFAFALGFIVSMLGIAPVGFSALFQIAVFVPSIAICARRLHDIGKSGRWQLISFIPVLGWIPLIIFFCSDSDIGNNEFGSSTALPIWLNYMEEIIDDIEYGIQPRPSGLIAKKINLIDGMPANPEDSKTMFELFLD